METARSAEALGLEQAVDGDGEGVGEAGVEHVLAAARVAKAELAGDDGLAAAGRALDDGAREVARDVEDSELFVVEDEGAVDGVLGAIAVADLRTPSLHRPARAADHSLAGRVGAPLARRGRTGSATPDACHHALVPGDGDVTERGTSSAVPHPTVIVPFERVGTEEQKGSLRPIATWVADHGIEADGPYRAARDLLLRTRPRFAGTPNPAGAPLARPDEDPVAAACRLVMRLDGSVLPIQGPPGSGKTHTGAQLITKLAAAGKKVGIAANSHKVICNLLEKTMAAAREAVRLLAVQKVKEMQEGCTADGVVLTTINGEVLAALDDGANVVAGTAWLWSREDMAGKVDGLVVDEAGQISLANTLAISRAADSLVLLGDPQQLNQPTKGVHPPGAGTSALEHVLADAATIAPDGGLFIPQTRRLHPDICAFTSETFYDGKLRPLEGLERQTVTSPGRLTGTGVRFIPVDHHANQSESPEEVEAIAGLFSELVSGGATWTDARGNVRTLTTDDVLIVAPYNAQVAALRTRLGPGARVGTVDKFQGQEAPVVICSMTTSSAEDAPRGMEFLYSRKRLNVATSRARCLAVVVANPALLQPQCRTPREIRLANAYCRLLELAEGRR